LSFRKTVKCFTAVTHLSSTNFYGKETRPSVLKYMIITDKQARKPYYVLTWGKKDKVESCWFCD